MFEEARFFSKGEDMAPFESILGKSVMLICEDMWHAKTPDTIAQMGVENVIILANSPARGFGGEIRDTKAVEGSTDKHSDTHQSECHIC